MKVLSLVGDRYAVLLPGSETGGRYAVIEGWVPPGSGSPPHVHRREDEAFHVVEGELTFTVDGVEKVIRAGEGLFAPRNIPHHFRNTGPVPAVVLITATPAGLEDFFEAAGEVLSGRNQAPLPPTPEAVGKLKRTAPAYGIELLLP